MVDRAAAARILQERVRPVALAKERVLDVPTALAPLLPQRGLQRGTVVATGGAATSLALALAGPATTAGSWAALVGLDRIGLAAAEELGVALERILLVGPVPTSQWAATVVAVAESVDLVLVAPPAAAVAPGVARRVAARVREQGSVLVQVGWPSGRWPERAVLELHARPLGWYGIGSGHGHLRGRQVELRVSGRHGADRGLRSRFWLPDADGRFAPVEQAPLVAVGRDGAGDQAGAGGGVDVGRAARGPRLALVREPA